MDLSKIVDIVIDIKVMETIVINIAPITAPSVMTITRIDEVTSTSHNNKNTSLENLSYYACMHVYMHTNHLIPNMMMISRSHNEWVLYQFLAWE